MKLWTQKELNTLSELYKEHDFKTCARLMGIPANKVKYAIGNHGFKCGRPGRFEKGNVPHHKGTHFTTAAFLATSFKKGRTALNILPVGSITTRNDKTNIAYKYIKLGPDHWKLLHRHNWEKENGPIPKNKILVFKDGNSMDCETHNLELITRAESMRRNTNRKKGSQTLKIVYQRERLRKIYELPPLTGHGKRIVNY